MSTNLTNRLLASVIKSRKATTLWDSEVRGFGARVSPTGRVTWLANKFIGRGKGSQQRIVVGHYPGMSLEDARREAGHAIARLAKGEDVVSQVKHAKRAKVERQQCPTLKTAVSDYLDNRKHDPRRDMSSRYEIELSQLFNNQVVPELGASKRVNAVTKTDVKDMLKKRRDAGHYVAARNLCVLLRPFFDWCIGEEYIRVSPMAEIETPAPAEKRQHTINVPEIKAFWSASYSFTDYCIGVFWRLSLMLLQRRGELAGLNPREFDLDKAEWIIPGARTKNGKDHLVPLPRQAVKELKALPRRSFVFGKYPDEPFSGFSKAKRQLEAVMVPKLQEIGEVMRPWRIHDLRRTGASLMSGVKAEGRKIQPHIIEAILNHTPGSLEATYQVWDLRRYEDEKRDALQAWATHLDALGAPSSVVPMSRAR